MLALATMNLGLTLRVYEAHGAVVEPFGAAWSRAALLRWGVGCCREAALFAAALVLVLAAERMAGAAPTGQAASPPPPSEVGALKQRADAAMDALNYPEALSLYSEAYALSRDPALLYNQGRAFEALDDAPSALDRLERFRGEAPPELRARVPGLDDRLAALRQRIATLEVNVNVAGARVVVRDKIVGTAPLAGALRLKPGKALVEVTLDGYLPLRRELDLRGGASASVDLVLHSKQTNGVLTIVTSAPAAAVRVDGSPLGDSPIDTTLPAGPHVIDVEKDGYRPLHSAVVVTAGETKRVVLTLEKQSGILGAWWFWTGVAVVAGGAIVTVVALTTERGSDEGSLPPGRVSGPLVRF